jgi:glycyl-tRNA synthetase
MNRDGLPEIAHEIVAALRGSGILVEFDDTGAIGRRYRRQDEVGTPFAITVDYDTKEDRTVTLRERDTMGQVRVAIETLPERLRLLLAGSARVDKTAP